VRVKIAVKMAEQALEKTKTTAPFSGLISDRLVETGQLVRTGQKLLQLVDLSQVRVKVQMVEADYVHVDPQDKVSVTIEAFDNQDFTGRIDKIGLVADSKTATFPVEVVLENKDLALKAGFSTKVSITTRILENIYTIPSQAVLYGGKGAYAFVVLGDRTVKKRSLTLGERKNQRVLVLKGLRRNDRVIIQGQNTVKPGQKVRIK